VDNERITAEWYFQSDYDLDTAWDMYSSGRYVYCVFMCHLSIEKALKGLFVKQTGNSPSRSHSLVYFIEQMELSLTDNQYEFIFTLNKVSVPTRYPDDLKKLFSAYTKERTLDLIEKTKEIQQWIKAQ
jgi:HEPN domain-containing protein